VLGIRREINRGEDIIFKTTGVKTSLFRPPYTCVNERINRQANNSGYTVIGWSVSSKDGGKKIKPEKIAEITLPYVKNGSIILLHDGDRIKGSSRLETVKALPLIIKSLKEQGYYFVTIPQLLRIQGTFDEGGFLLWRNPIFYDKLKIDILHFLCNPSLLAYKYLADFCLSPVF